MKFSNFRVQDARIEIAGVVLDLHDILLLLSQTYDVKARRLVLTFGGPSFQPEEDLLRGNHRDAKLVLTFEEVSFLRMQVVPIAADTDACLIGFQPVETCIRRGDAPDIVVIFNELFASDEQDDWTGWWVLIFAHGPDILVNAAEVHATFSQRCDEALASIQEK